MQSRSAFAAWHHRAERVVTCEGLQVLLPQQMFFLVVQRTEELPARPTVQVLVSRPLWTGRLSEQGGAC